MNWTRVTAWAEISDCERYTVSMAKAKIGYNFEAWLRATMKGRVPESLGMRSTPEEAKGLCEAHAARVAA